MSNEITAPVQNAFAWDSSDEGSKTDADSPCGPSRRVTRAEATRVAPAVPAAPRPEPLGARETWLTTDEAVAYLGLPSRKALYQAVRRGQVPAHRLGVRRMRFSRGELDELLRGAAGDGRGK